MRLLKLSLILGTMSLFVVAPLAAQVLINEIRIDQPSGDTDEYFELVGPPLASLDGYTYLVIGDGTGGSGTIETVVDLTGYVIQADGVVAFTDSDSGTDVLTGYDYVLAGNALNFENSDNVTHLLVTGFTGANGDDLDTDDDCSLDVTPWTAVIDLIALIEEDNPPASTECHYGPPTVGPDGSFVPGHVYRCESSWVIGPFDPVGGDDTPGAANNCPTPTLDKTWGQIKSRNK